MEEIKVGEYVRTTDEKIDKVIEISGKYILLKNNFKITEFIENRIYIKIKDIIKHSTNIIDLMQVKDVIEYIEQTEGREGTVVGETYITDIHSENELNEIKKEIQENGIKLLSITTKEQFNQVKYEV